MKWSQTDRQTVTALPEHLAVQPEMGLQQLSCVAIESCSGQRFTHKLLADDCMPQFCIELWLQEAVLFSAQRLDQLSKLKLQPLQEVRLFFKTSNLHLVMNVEKKDRCANNYFLHDGPAAIWVSKSERPQLFFCVSVCAHKHETCWAPSGITIAWIFCEMWLSVLHISYFELHST